MPTAIRNEISGDYEAAHAGYAEAASVGEHFRDSDLLALAVHAQGTALIKLGQVGQGLALLDEAMVAVTAG